MTKFYQFVGEVDSYKFKMQKKDACFVSKLHVQKNIYIHIHEISPYFRILSFWNVKPSTITHFCPY
jgi:hypothetical protein